MKYAINLTIFSVLIYGLMSYWGIRSPDSEVVFRITESLSTEGSFAASEQVTTKGFGLTYGKAGKLYSVFGPGQSVAAVPLYKFAQIINSTGWYNNNYSLVSKNHYYKDGFSDFVMGGIDKGSLEANALRTIVSSLNIIFGAASVFVFFLIIRKLTQSDKAAFFTSLLFAFGTLIFPYTGTFFSEVMATFFVILSFYLIINYCEDENPHKSFGLIASGISLGLAASTHITAILFAPFLLIYAALKNNKLEKSKIKQILFDGSLFAAGLGVIIMLLAWYNAARFGSPFETGRTVIDQSEYLGYGTFVAPWRGLWGLTFGASKGLFLYSPVILLSIFVWRPFHKKFPLLSWIIIATVLFRMIFIASRSDWHGGSCIGPRYLLMIVPLILLPIGEFARNIIEKKKYRAITGFAVFSFFCIAQQLFFSLGEIFSYLSFILRQAYLKGIDLFQNDMIYLKWNLSPLRYLLNGRRSPLLLQSLYTDNYMLWIFLCSIAALLLLLIYYFVLKENNNAINVTADETI